METAPGTPILLSILSVLGLVLLNAFFVAAEFSLVGARKTRLDEMAQNGDRKAILARRAVQSLTKFISVTQLGITLTSLGLGWIGEPALARIFVGMFAWLPDPLSKIATHGVAATIAFILISVLHIVLGELVPKALALIYPELIVTWIILPLMAVRWTLAGPAFLLNWTANALLRLVRVPPLNEHDRLHSPEEIRMLVEQSEEGGSLGKSDARLLEGVFEFSEKSAQEVMTPRTQVIGLARDLAVELAADEVAVARRSRYPVFTDSLDDIVGVVHAKDILTALRAAPGATVGSIMRPPLFVPGTREVEDVLTDMKRLKVHLAVVLDEYGGTAGLVTMEDLLEEIVGDIFDEYDRQERLPAPREGERMLDGAMPLSDFNTEFDTSLDDTDYTTLGGYLFGQMGRLPKAGDRVAVGNDNFEIVEMDGRRVKTVRHLAPVPQP
ncbi:MAG: hemolysin family protein [Gemmatimonadota bacterium]